tara:strand:- start:120 stop:311 length:192 start_codon:yes stop_codon:yes gene_type:complete
MKITRKTPLHELATNKKAAEILLENGMHCLGCFAAHFEDLEQGCKAHRMSEKQIEELIKKLNS